MERNSGFFLFVVALLLFPSANTMMELDDAPLNDVPELPVAFREKETTPPMESDYDLIQVIVVWRESMSLTAQTLQEVLADDTVPINVTYCHVDLHFFEQILEEVLELQQKYPEKLHIVRFSSWYDRYSMISHVIQSFPTKPRWIASHDNNNLGLTKGWLHHLRNAILFSNPRPILAAPDIQEVSSVGANPENHHSLMKVEISFNNGFPILAYSKSNGQVVENSLGMNVYTAHAVEIHSYLFDTHRLSSPDEIFSVLQNNPFASHHITVGLYLWEKYGMPASVVVTDLKYNYMYPVTHLKLVDAIVSVVRWATYDNMASNRYLEQRYSAIYANECGFDWHLRKAISSVTFYEQDNVLMEDPVNVAALLTAFYSAQHLNNYHIVQHQREETQVMVKNKKLRPLMQWISDNALLIEQIAESGCVNEQSLVLVPFQNLLPLNYHREKTPGEFRNSSAFVRNHCSVKKSVLMGQRAYVLPQQNINFCMGQFTFMVLKGNFDSSFHTALTACSGIVLASKVHQTNIYIIMLQKIPEDKEHFLRLLNKLQLAHSSRNKDADIKFEISIFTPMVQTGTCNTPNNCEIFGTRYAQGCYGISSTEPIPCKEYDGLPLVIPTYKLIKWNQKADEKSSGRGYRRVGYGFMYSFQLLLKKLQAV